MTGDMSAEVLEQAVTWTMEASKFDKSAGIGFFGGEPLLARSAMVRAVSMAERMAEELDIAVGFSTSTNGTLLTDADAKYLAYHRFLVQLSLDGGPASHDVHRRFHDGRPTASTVLMALNRLERAGAYVEVASVITPGNVTTLPDSFAMLTRSLGVRRLSMALSVTSDWGKSDLMLLEEALSRVGEELAGLYRDGVEVVVDLFDEPIEAHIRGYHPHQYCPFGLGKVAVDIDGTLYPCDRVAGEGRRASVAIGHLDRGIDSDKLEDMRHHVGLEKPPCPTCEIAGRCRHWCGCVNIDASGHYANVSDTFCDLQRLRVKAADTMAEALYQERNPLFLGRFYEEQAVE